MRDPRPRKKKEKKTSGSKRWSRLTIYRQSRNSPLLPANWRGKWRHGKSGFRWHRKEASLFDRKPVAAAARSETRQKTGLTDTSAQIAEEQDFPQAHQGVQQGARSLPFARVLDVPCECALSSLRQPRDIADVEAAETSRRQKRFFQPYLWVSVFSSVSFSKATSSITPATPKVDARHTHIPACTETAGTKIPKIPGFTLHLYFLLDD